MDQPVVSCYHCPRQGVLVMTNFFSSPGIVAGRNCIQFLSVSTIYCREHGDYLRKSLRISDSEYHFYPKFGRQFGYMSQTSLSTAEFSALASAVGRDHPSVGVEEWHECPDESDE